MFDECLSSRASVGAEQAGFVSVVLRNELSGGPPSPKHTARPESLGSTEQTEAVY